MNKPEVVMIGLGYIGLPTAALIASNNVLCPRSRYKPQRGR